MKLSTKCRYGIRAILEIAAGYKQGPIKRKDISKEQDIPDSYLENILLVLKKNGIISAIRGAKGGFVLNFDPESLTVYDVVKALDGAPAPVDCLDFPDYCGRTSTCLTRPIYRELQSAQEKVLKSFTIQYLLDQKENTSLDFSI